MVVGGILAMNPASAVRGPKYVIKKGKTPVLTRRRCSCSGFRSMRTELSGLRDRALLAVMVYSFARVSAVVGMNVEDYYQQGKRLWVRLHEKGGKHHECRLITRPRNISTPIFTRPAWRSKRHVLWRSMTKERGLGDGRIARTRYGGDETPCARCFLRAGRVIAGYFGGLVGLKPTAASTRLNGPPRAPTARTTDKVCANNGAVVRKLVVWSVSGLNAAAALAAACQSARLYCELLPALLQTSKVRTSMA